MSDYIYISGLEHRISELEAENKELKKALEQANDITKKLQKKIKNYVNYLTVSNV